MRTFVLVTLLLARPPAWCAAVADFQSQDLAVGLPGNLAPVKKGDDVHENHKPEATGEPRLDDGSDGFQFYENGGATGCWAYHTVKALYGLRSGRIPAGMKIAGPAADSDG